MTPQRIPADQLLVGAHTSAAGGPHNALIEGKSIGATQFSSSRPIKNSGKGNPNRG